MISGKYRLILHREIFENHNECPQRGTSDANNDLSECSVGSGL